MRAALNLGWSKLKFNLCFRVLTHLTCPQQVVRYVALWWPLPTPDLSDHSLNQLAIANHEDP